MQKTILISGTYPILDEKLNDLLGRSYDIAALEQPFPVNARKFGWVEAVVVYVPYCGEPEDAAAAQRYTEARAAADWATKEGLHCALLIDAEAHSFLPCFPSACTVFILPELYGLDRRGRPVGWLGEAMRRSAWTRMTLYWRISSWPTRRRRASMPRCASVRTARSA